LTIIIILIITPSFYSCFSERINIQGGDGEQLITTITPEKAYELIQNNSENSKFNIIDIRTPSEYAAVHIANAVLIDYYSDAFEQELDKLDRQETYLVYCRSGNRSGNAMIVFKDLGFIHVYDMGGGISSWERKKYPVEK
jgi:rhodanese-related sulfurtransferase